MASRHAAIFASTLLGLCLYSASSNAAVHPHNCESQFEVGTLDES